jgi:hypothetical protein
LEVNSIVTLSNSPGVVRSKQSIGEFWREEFDEGERGFTEWLLDEVGRRPIGRPAEVRFEIERVTDTYLWDLESEVKYEGGKFRIDGRGRGFHQGKNSNVVIEAQFDRDQQTTFKHLGKMFVYAQLVDADVIIWITPRKIVRNSKQFPRSISYIDENSNIEFYHIFIDVKQIEENDTKTEAGNVYESPKTTDSVETEFSKSQKMKFWLMLEDEREARLTGSTEPKPQTVYRCGRAIQMTGVNPEFRIDTTSNQVKFRVRFEGAQAEEEYRSLKYGPTYFENKIKPYQEINWSDESEQQVPVLEITRSGFSLYNQKPWKNLIQWLFRNLSAFRDVL